MTIENDLTVSDHVTAALVECVPEPEPAPDVPVPAADPATPIAVALDATIEQTGAGPPPKA